MRLLTGCWMYGWCFLAPPIAFMCHLRPFAAILSGIFWVISLVLLTDQAPGFALILWLICVLVAWSAIKFKRSDRYSDKRVTNDRKMLLEAMRSTAPIKAYYDDNIREWVRTSGQHRMLKRIRSMDIEDVISFNHTVRMEARIDPALERTLTGKIVCKAVMRRSQALKNAGVTRIEQIACTRTIGAMIWHVVFWIIVIEIVQSLFGRLVSHVKQID